MEVTVMCGGPLSINASVTWPLAYCPKHDRPLLRAVQFHALSFNDESSCVISVKLPVISL